MCLIYFPNPVLGKCLANHVLHLGTNITEKWELCISLGTMSFQSSDFVLYHVRMICGWGGWQGCLVLLAR
jgi:hypothetical protein